MERRDTVTEDVELLLENSAIDESYHFRVNDKHCDLGVEDIIIEKAYVGTISHPQTIDITKLYYQQPMITQRLILKLMCDMLEKANLEMARTITNVLFQTGNIAMLTKVFKGNFIQARQLGYVYALEQLSCIMYACWPGFSKEEVRNIRQWCKDVRDKRNTLGAHVGRPSSSSDESRTFQAVTAIYGQTNRILVLDVKQRIDLGFNPEINEDEAKLKDVLVKFGFPPDLSRALDKVDEKLGAPKDAFDYKGCMDLLRSFTELLYRSILDQYGDAGKKIPEQSSEKVGKFLKEQGLIGEDFRTMLVSQRHFLSNLASHRLKSREEDARLSRNMVIEMSLYLLRRLQNH